MKKKPRAIRRVEYFEGEWSEGYATSLNYYLDTRRSGLRISVMRWETGKVEVKLIKGDGRNRSEFEEFARYELIKPTDADVQSTIYRLRCF